MTRLLRKIIGLIVNAIFIPVLAIIAIPAGMLKASQTQKSRLFFTGKEQLLLAKAQNTINMEINGILCPDKDLLEVARCIENARTDYQLIKARERYDVTFSEFLQPRLRQCNIFDWRKVEDFFNLQGQFIASTFGKVGADMAWKQNLCNWLNRSVTIEPEDMTAEDMSRVVKGNFDPLTIAKVECLVLGDFQGGREISVLPDSLFELRALRSLHLQRNNIEQLNDRVGQLCNLEELKLGGNSLKSLPASIGQLRKLRILTLWWNDNLSSLPPQIGELSELEGLDVSACDNLKELPQEITKLRKLQKLYLPAHSDFKLTIEQEAWIQSIILDGAEVSRHW